MELFRILGTIAVNSSDANAQIDETTGRASKAQGLLSKGLTKIGGIATTVSKVGVAAIGVAAAGIAALTSSAANNYAEYEQLVGGVETLFKDSSSIVKGYANNAYKTAGMSANNYMDTVTSFSASLLQGLGGDTQKAADVANLAVTDMSDNANKMGTSMDAIQNAYQGFAKQNYTMLDNLKLGYGGTQSEMARLINDSGVLGDTMTVTAETVNQVSFDQMIEAIHIVQTNMGITGTTALEASTTIQGSVGMMSAAWQNFLTGAADPTQDFGVLIDNLVTTIVTAVDNLIPRILETLPRIIEGLTQIVLAIAPYLPGLISQLLPSLVEGAVAVLTSLVTGLPEILVALFPAVLQALIDLISQLGAAITQTSQETMESGVTQVFNNIGTVFQTLWDGIQLIWQSIGQPIFEAFQTIAQTVFSAFSDAASNSGITFSGVMGGIQQAFQLVSDVLNSIFNTVLKPVFDLINSCIQEVASVFSEKMPEIQEFVSQCFSDISNIWNENLKPCFDAIGQFINDVLAPAFKTVFGKIIKPIVDTCFNGIKSLWNGTLKPIFVGITDFISGVFTGNWEKAFGGLVSIVTGIFDGIINAVKIPINFVIDIINGFIGGLNMLKIPDWVPVIGGAGINIPLIPHLAKGGVLKKGQTGFLEGNGDEAVVPLSQNTGWMNTVAERLDILQKENKSNVGNDEVLKKLDDLILAIKALKIYLDGRVLVGELASDMDAELGRIYVGKVRGTR